MPFVSGTDADPNVDDLNPVTDTDALQRIAIYAAGMAPSNVDSREDPTAIPARVDRLVLSQ